MWNPHGCKLAKGYQLKGNILQSERQRGVKGLIELLKSVVPCWMQETKTYWESKTSLNIHGIK